MRKRHEKLQALVRLRETKGEEELKDDQLRALEDAAVVEGKLSLLEDLSRELSDIDAADAKESEAQERANKEQARREHEAGQREAATAATREAQAKAQKALSAAETSAAQRADSATTAAIEQLMRVMYLGRLFDRVVCCDPTSTAEERETALGYMLLGDAKGGAGAAVAVRTQGDLDEMARVSRLLTSRPQGIALSHEDAVQRCVALAKALVEGAEVRALCAHHLPGPVARMLLRHTDNARCLFRSALGPI